MDDKVMLWRLGILVLSTILVAATLIIYLGPGFQQTYRIYIKCDKAPGVTPETPVHRNGILIGRVDKVKTLDEGGVEMELRINKGVRLFSDEEAQIGLTSILGESVIEFVPGRGERVRELLEDNSRLTNESVRHVPDPLDMVVKAFEKADEFDRKFEELRTSIMETSDKIGEASEEFKTIGQNINSALGDESAKNLGDFFEKVNQISTNVDLFIQTYTLIGQDIRSVTGDPLTQFSMKTAIQQFPGLVEKADSTLEDFGKTNKIFGEVGTKANEAMDEVIKFTKSDFVNDLSDSLEGIGSLLSSVKDSKGTLGLLLNDPSVYNRMNNSLRRIESITYKLEPILRDVRVFSSKIATDPRQLGVKGALDRRPSGTGVKGSFLMPQPQESERWSPRSLFDE